MKNREDEKMIELLISGKIAPSNVLAQLEVCAFRKEIYKILHHKSILLEHAELIRCLLAIEMTQYDKGPHSDDTYDYECFYWCIFLLSRVKDVADVKLLWEAKSINFDTHCGVDIQFLVGAGVDHIIS